MDAPLRFASLPSTAFLMAAIAGFTDVIGFVGVDKLFTAHITGNIVVAIAELIHHAPGVASKILSLPLFIFIAILITAFIETRGQTKKLLSFFLIFEALLLTVFMVGGIAFLPELAVNSPAYIAIGMAAVSAMAIHNTLLRTFMASFPPCTVMTGNLTQLIIDGVSYLWGWRKPHTVEKRETSRIGIHRHGNVFAGFLLGGAAAAGGYIAIGFKVVALPVFVLLYMALKNRSNS